jgi:hypothetical protein
VSTRLMNPVTGGVLTLREGEDEQAYRMQGWVEAPGPEPLPDPGTVSNGDSDVQVADDGNPIPTDLGPDTLAEAPTETNENQEG